MKVSQKMSFFTTIVLPAEGYYYVLTSSYYPFSSCPAIYVFEYELECFKYDRKQTYRLLIYYLSIPEDEES